jgi:hypothetical protein
LYASSSFHEALVITVPLLFYFFVFIFVFVFVFVLFFIVLAVFVHLLIVLRLVWPRRSTTEPVLGDADTQRRAPTIDSTAPPY